MEITDISANNSHCKHEYFIDAKNIGTCRHCGMVVQFSKDGRAPPNLIKAGVINIPGMPLPEKPVPSAVPPKPPGKREIGSYYDAHRIEIEADIKEIGQKAALNKWDIASGTWVGIQKRWQGIIRVRDRSQSKDTPQSEVGKTQKFPPAGEPTPMEDKTKSLELEINYLRGWRDCAIEFLRVQHG